MCGVSGIVDLHGRGIDRDAVIELRDTLAHRGPDDVGCYFDEHVGLGHRRLSIIDLTAAGRQPISNEDGTVQVMCNGEIYNYRTLRGVLEQAGHRFTTRSDTEVILHAFEEYGPSCIDHLNGMFAVAIWNIETRELFVARDRLGIKPLVYYGDGRVFIFASEIKAILAHPHADRSVDRSALGFLSPCSLPLLCSCRSALYRRPSRSASLRWQCCSSMWHRCVRRMTASIGQ